MIDPATTAASLAYGQAHPSPASRPASGSTPGSPPELDAQIVLAAVHRMISNLSHILNTVERRPT